MTKRECENPQFHNYKSTKFLMKDISHMYNVLQRKNQKTKRYFLPEIHWPMRGWLGFLFHGQTPDFPSLPHSNHPNGEINLAQFHLPTTLPNYPKSLHFPNPIICPFIWQSIFPDQKQKQKQPSSCILPRPWANRETREARKKAAANDVAGIWEVGEEFEGEFEPKAEGWLEGSDADELVICCLCVYFSEDCLCLLCLDFHGPQPSLVKNGEGKSWCF